MSNSYQRIDRISEEVRRELDAIIRENAGGSGDAAEQDKINGIVRAFRNSEEEEKLQQIDDVANKAKWILAAVAGVLALLLLTGAVRRIVLKGQSAKALDHLEGGSYRNYSEMPKKRRRSEISAGGTGEKQETRSAVQPRQAEAPAQSGEVMAETLRKLYERRGQENPGGETAFTQPAAAPAEQSVPAEPAVTASPRRHAANTEAPAPEIPAQPIQTASEAAHRRRARK